MTRDDNLSKGITKEEWHRLCAVYELTEICYSVITGRCGSTYLASMCRALGFGDGGEPLNDMAKTPALVSISALEKVIQERARNGRWYFQLNLPRYKSLKKYLPVLSNGQKPSIILRRDIFAQALSFSNAQATGLWHVVNEQEIKRVSPNQIEPTEWVHRISAQERQLIRMFPESLILYYEDIVAAPIESLVRFLGFHAYDVDLAKIEDVIQHAKTQKIIRDGYSTQYTEMIKNYPDELVDTRLRSGFSLEFCSQLQRLAIG